MKNYLILLVLFLCSPYVWAQDIAGSWNGKLVLPNGTSLTLVFHITQTNQGYASTFDSPDQGVKGVPTGATTFNNNTLSISIPSIMASYKGEWKENGRMEGTFTQGIHLPLNLIKGEVVKPKRPQEPHEPFPYHTEEVQFRNKQAGITLAGTLTLPQQQKNFPVVILVTGSGPQDRNEELFGHKPFWVIADYLTRKGIAVLRFDDRGVGKSEGDFKSSDGDDFEADAAAAFEYLKSRKGINSKKIGFLGHSEGGSIAFTQAARNKEVAFIIALAAPGVKGDSLMLRQAELIGKSQGATDVSWEIQKPILRNRYALLTKNRSNELLKQELYEDVTRTIPAESLKDEHIKQQIEDGINTMTSPWYLHFMRHDPTDDLQKIHCPVLALNGERDVQVDAEMNLTAIESNITKNGNKQVTIKKYPNLNHLFQYCKNGTLSEYGQLEETIYPEVLQDIANWILKSEK